MTWKRYKMEEGKELPDNALFVLEKEKYGGCWSEAYYRGDVNTTKDWIVVLDTGCYYKVGAATMTWYFDPKGSGEIYGKCNWSKSALHRTIIAIKQGENPPYDPGYQT